MPGLYLDTSALGRVLLDEPDAAVIVRELGRYDEHVASRLLGVELRRLALRHGLLENAEQLLAGVALIPADEPIFAAAGTVPPSSVGSLDAIHLVTALRLSDAGLLDAVMTYDARLAAGAEQHGLTVVAPT